MIDQKYEMMTLPADVIMNFMHCLLVSAQILATKQKTEEEQVRLNYVIKIIEDSNRILDELYPGIDTTTP